MSLAQLRRAYSNYMCDNKKKILTYNNGNENDDYNNSQLVKTENIWNENIQVTFYSKQ